MTDERKPAPAHKPAKPNRKPPVHKSTRPGQPPAKPIFQGTIPAARSIPAAAIAVTLGAGALIGRALFGLFRGRR